MVAEDSGDTGNICVFIFCFLVRRHGRELVGCFQDGKKGGIGDFEEFDGVVFWCDCWEREEALLYGVFEDGGEVRSPEDVGFAFLDWFEEL